MVIEQTYDGIIRVLHGIVGTLNNGNLGESDDLCWQSRNTVISKPELLGYVSFSTN